MNRIGFAFNPTNDAAVELRDRALAWCSGQGIGAWTAQAGDRDSLERELPTSDALVVLGGDGTFLRAARGVASVDVPILGINCGKVGFLSKAESTDLEAVLGQLQASDFRLEPRMMLEASLVRAGAGAPHPGTTSLRATDASAASLGATDASHPSDAGASPPGAPDTHLALNEAAVVRGSQARVMHVEVSIDDTHLATYVCDGIVVASPTGSTGYSFSAGGPIVDSSARNLVVTPIAAYLTALRSVVVGPQHSVGVRVLEAFDCLLSIDGREDLPLAVGDQVVVAARARPIRFIEPTGAPPFWDLLRRKAELLPS